MADDDGKLRSIAKRIDTKSETWDAVLEMLTYLQHKAEGVIAKHGQDIVGTEYNRGRRDVALDMLRAVKPKKPGVVADAGFGGDQE